jgi:hypothetical protein
LGNSLESAHEYTNDLLLENAFFAGKGGFKSNLQIAIA